MDAGIEGMYTASEQAEVTVVMPTEWQEVEAEWSSVVAECADLQIPKRNETIWWLMK